MTEHAAKTGAADGTSAQAQLCAIRYDNVAFSYKPGAPFIEGLSARIESGSVTSIIGPNGCGKSTLVKLASGLLRPASGRVEVKGRDTGSLSARERARELAVLAQSSRVPPVNVEALVALGRHPHTGMGGRLGPRDRERVEAALERAGVARFRDHDVRKLSGGERQRAFVAMTLAQDTDLIVLDEPTTYLDIGQKNQVMELVRDLNVQGRTILAVLHDLPLAFMYSDYVALMESGKLTAFGTPDEVREPAAKAFGVKQALVTLEGREQIIFY